MRGGRLGGRTVGRLIVLGETTTLAVSGKRDCEVNEGDCSGKEESRLVIMSGEVQSRWCGAKGRIQATRRHGM